MRRLVHAWPETEIPFTVWLVHLGVSIVVRFHFWSEGKQGLVQAPLNSTLCDSHNFVLVWRVVVLRKHIVEKSAHLLRSSRHRVEPVSEHF